MMGFWNWFLGHSRVQLICADAALALEKISYEDIALFDVKCDDEAAAVYFSVRSQDVDRVIQIGERHGYCVKILKRFGFSQCLKALKQRPVLVIGFSLLIALSFWIPSRIFFIRVEGNSAVPTRLILEQAEQCGVFFGSSRAKIRSQQVKDTLLGSIEGLDWAGITTRGCVATIQVSERSVENTPKGEGVCSIIASRDGIITGCTATKGKLLCHVGQAVQQGQVLISGYNDCSILIQAVRAEGEVYAQTRRELTACVPMQYFKTEKTAESEKKYALIIGKKRINFYKDSGISGSSCVKMYSQYYITLPGGFVLPVAIVTEQWYRTELSSSETSRDQAQQILSDFAARYIPGCMVAGCIMNGQEEILTGDAHYMLQGNYACLEMIGQVRNEEIIKSNGNDY